MGWEIVYVDWKWRMEEGEGKEGKVIVESSIVTLWLDFRH